MASAQSDGLVIKSSAFKHNGDIPKVFTCQGKDTSPPLEWDHAPKGTKTFALIVDDPDAPDPKNPQRTWVHWVLYNIPLNVKALAENIQALPPGAKDGLNDWKRSGYGGPCPPIGRHRYFHKLFALDKELTFKSTPTKAELEAAMEGHILGRAELIGTYQK
ncbi:MAG: YbhB/YbcL family Raf kinase inhibitor-like protein [Deltaproteobacteria bacterium]|nr:YbhB/YbcL family Raf kinase inhibitor-like protein [Deltaproteobacteria bacterium]